MLQKGFMKTLSVKIKLYVILYFNYFKMLGTGRVSKVFFPGIFINI